MMPAFAKGPPPKKGEGRWQAAPGKASSTRPAKPTDSPAAVQDAHHPQEYTGRSNNRHAGQSFGGYAAPKGNAEALALQAAWTGVAR